MTVTHETIIPPPAFSFLPDRVDTIPRRMAHGIIETHHYLHRAPPGDKFCLGIFNGMSLMGVMIFGRPVARNEDQVETLELTRMFIFDSPKNSESRAIKLAVNWIKLHHPHVKRLIAYAACEVHEGTIYKASNWTALGANRSRRGDWASREGRIKDVMGKKYKFERILK